MAFTGRKTKCGLAFAFCMLAYYAEWRMRRALAPMLFEDDLDRRGRLRITMLMDLTDRRCFMKRIFWVPFLVIPLWLISCGNDNLCPVGDLLDTFVPDALVDTTDDEITGDTDECQHWHYPGDRTYGERCWDPPENLCRDGFGADSASWYCSPDGQNCCFSYSIGCFYCGWVECAPQYSGEEISQACADLNVPQKYIDCANHKETCLPEVSNDMYNSEICLAIPFGYFNTSLRYCWDKYVQ